MEILYIDRQSKEKREEKVYGQMALSLLYGDGFLKGLFSKLVLPVLAHIPFFSHFYGWLQKRRPSKKKIAPFIKTYKIDQSEFLDTEFKSFNDFFIRKLKSEKRPVVQDKNVCVLPADARYLVFSQIGEFQIKGKRFSLNDFLQNPSLANRYQEGSIVIARLCPSDYHRFHFPCDAIASKPYLINGPLYSVNPMALRKKISILSENKRVITELETERFGTIQYVEIGATAVGSIHQTFEPGVVQKGQEKGFFEFGGSCIVLLFEKNRILFDFDLSENTENGFETKGNYGMSLGTSQEPISSI